MLTGCRRGRHLTCAYSSHHVEGHAGGEAPRASSPPDSNTMESPPFSRRPAARPGRGRTSTRCASCVMQWLPSTCPRRSGARPAESCRGAPGHQPIVDHDLRALEPAQPPSRDQLRSPGTRPHHTTRPRAAQPPAGAPRAPCLADRPDERADLAPIARRHPPRAPGSAIRASLHPPPLPPPPPPRPRASRPRPGGAA